MSESLLLNEACKFKLEPNKEQVAILDSLFKAYIMRLLKPDLIKP